MNGGSTKGIDVAVRSRSLVSIAVAALVLSFLTLAVTVCQYQERSARTQARALVEVESEGLANYAFRYENGEIDGLSMAVTVIEPLTETAAPPPGLDEWMAPGEVAASPVLADRSEISGRYGPVTQVIDSAGLGSETERLIYYRPPQFAVSIGMRYASSFGAPVSFETSSEDILAERLQLVVGLELALLVVPSAVFLAGTTSLSAEAFKQRLVSLETLGLTPRQAWWMSSRKLRRAWLLGLLIAVFAVAVVSFAGIRLPDYYIAAASVRTWLPQLAGVFLAASLFAFAVVGAVTWVWRLDQANRPRPKNKQPVQGRTVLAIGVAFAVLTAGSYVLSFYSTYAMLGLIASVLLVAGFAKTVSRYCLQKLWAKTRHWGMRTLRPVPLVAGAQGATGSGLGARAISVNLLLTFVVIQICGYLVLGASLQTEIASELELIAGQVVQIDLEDSPASVPQAAATMIETTATQGASVLIAFDSETLESEFWSPHPDEFADSKPLQTAVNAWLSGVGVELAGEMQNYSVEAQPLVDAVNVVQAHSPQTQYLLLVAPQTAEIQTSVEAAIQTLQTQASQLVKPLWLAKDFTYSQMGVLPDGIHQMRWIVLFGGIGVSLMLVTSAVRLVKDIEAEAASLILVSEVFGAGDLAIQVIRLRIAATSAVLLALTFIACFPYAQFINLYGYSTKLPTLVLGGIMGTVALGTAILAATYKQRDCQTFART